MKTNCLRPILLCGLCLTLANVSLQAEDLTSRSGETFRDVLLMQLGVDFVVVKHRGGTENILLKDLPAPWQKRLSAPALFEELRHKEQELENLKQKLQNARGETQTLKTEAHTLKQEKQELAAAADKAGVIIPPRKPVPLISSLPPLNPETLIAAEDLAGQFRTDPQGAGPRYKGKTFRVQGVTERFERKMFVRNYDVILETGDRTTKVVCNVPYPDEYKAIYPKEGGQRLVGNSERRGEITLLKAGAKLTFKGRCAGMKDNQIVLTDCALID